MKILKLGGSAITDKKGYEKPKPVQIRKMAEAIAWLWAKGSRDLVVVHGAGSFGHAHVLKHGINNGVKTDAERLGYADTHSSCVSLSQLVVKALVKAGVPAISLPPAAIIRQRNKRIEEFRDDVVRNYLSAGYLPVLHGDMVPDSELGGSVCSGDQIMAWLGKRAELLVFATDVDGVLDDEGRLIPVITKTNFTEVSRHLKVMGHDVTGAMRGKITELLTLDTPSCIANATEPDRIVALLSGKEAVCTWINPKGR